METKMDEQIAQVILADFKRQSQTTGWVDDSLGADDVTLDGHFDFVQAATAVRKSLTLPEYRVEAVRHPGAGKPTTVHADSLLDACDVAQGLLNSGLFGHGVEIYSRKEGEWKSIYSSSQPWTEEYSLEEYVIANNLDR